MNYHTDWERAEEIELAYSWRFRIEARNRKTFAIRSAALALLAFTTQWWILDLALRFIW